VGEGRLRLYGILARLHDLWIILAWAGLVASIMLNTFLNRSCAGFIHGDLLEPCASSLDFVLIIFAAVGAGVAFLDERVALVGVIAALALASVFFIAALQIAPYLGLQDPVYQDALLSQSFAVTFNYLFPVPLIGSFFGTLAGLYLDSRFRISEVSAETALR
jgi:hypothetical protein